jgi:hypothetical protein
MQHARFPRPSRRTATIGAALVIGLVGGGAIALAAGSGGPVHPRTGTSLKSPAKITSAMGQPCTAGYDTEVATNTPPDDTTTDNSPAASVSIRKQCVGAVIGRFSGEVSVPGAGDFIHIDMLATCVAAAGLSNPCTVGEQVFGSPGHTFFSNGADAFGVHAVDMVWSGLSRGKWKFEVLPGGNSVANLQFRTFDVTAFAGG